MSETKNSSAAQTMRFFIVLLAVCLIGAAIMLGVQLLRDSNDTAAPDTSAVIKNETTKTPDTTTPVTTAPITTTPVTTAPITTTPVTTAPMTTAPVTTAPVTTAPVTTAPVTTAPVTTAPVTTAPVTTAPVTTAPKPSAPKYDLDAWYLTLVNPWNKLSLEYIDTIELVTVRSNIKIDSRIIDPLKKMLADCYAANPTVSDKCSGKPLVCSGFRTQEYQEGLFNKKINKIKAAKPNISDDEAYALAAKEVAIPGTSEHQLGLAVDIVCCSAHYNLDAQKTKIRQQWLIDNCHKYGFILRYPADKTGITGIIYEPWHYRYVGVDVATDIMSRGICFEEWLAEQKAQ